MNLRELEYLVAIADHRHFGRAASSVFVSQPTLSTQLKKLESELGVQLVERSRGGVLLTAAGQAVVERARVVLRETADIRDIARRAADPSAATLRVGLFPTLGPYLLPHVVPHVRERMPRVELLLVEEKTEVILQQLADGTLDVGVLALPVDDGTTGQVLQTDGSGNLSWVSAASTAMAVKVDSTSVAFGSGSTLTAFTLPANAVIHLVRVIVDTAFDATGPAQLTVGYNGGSASAYMAASENDLTTAAVYDVAPGVAASGSTRDLEVYFTAGTGGSAGAARVEVHYSIPT